MTAVAEAPAFTAARRGDLVVVHEHVRDYVIGQGASEYDRYEVGVVTSVTRDGLVKRYTGTWGSEVTIRGHVRCQLVPRAAVDVAGAFAAAKAHTWPGHPTQPKAYESLEEVRAAVRPFRRS
jgi:hypothetical protein